MGTIIAGRGKEQARDKFGGMFKKKDNKLMLQESCLVDEDLVHVFSIDVASLKTLNLNNNLLEGYSPSFDRLILTPMPRLMILSKNQLCDEGLEKICKGNWPQLINLSLQINFLTSKGMQFFLKSNFDQLQELELDQNQIESEGVLQLTKRQWPQLRNLSLFGNCLGDKAARYLKQSHFNKLQRLDLAQNMISFRALKLMILGHWKNLKDIRVWNTQLNVQLQKNLKKWFTEILSHQIDDL